MTFIQLFMTFSSVFHDFIQDESRREGDREGQYNSKNGAVGYR